MSPFIYRLGLGAEPRDNTTPPRTVTDSRVWQSVREKRKSHHPSRSGSAPEGNKLIAHVFTRQSGFNRDLVTHTVNGIAITSPIASSHRVIEVHCIMVQIPWSCKTRLDIALL